jgi:hypothetical protein
MLRSAVTLLIFCAAFVGTAVGAQANTLGCGGNSFSYAEVVPRHRGALRKGPIQVVPDSLCADLLEERRSGIESLHLSLDPHSSLDSQAQAPRHRSQPR